MFIFYFDVNDLIWILGIMEKVDVDIFSMFIWLINARAKIITTINITLTVASKIMNTKKYSSLILLSKISLNIIKKFNYIIFIK